MGLKNILPFENYVLTTRLPVAEVLKRIQEIMEPKRSFSLSTLTKSHTRPYTGQTAGNGFTMTRNIEYRNSFLPVITGQAETFLGNTQVTIKMRPAIVVLVFISFWLGLVGLTCMGILLMGIFQFRQIVHSGFSPMLLIPFAMFAFGCLLTHFAFKGESRNSKKFLASLLEGNEQ